MRSTHTDGAPAVAVNELSSEMGASSPPLSWNITAAAVRNSAFVLGAQILLKVLAFLFNVYVVRKLGAVHFGRYSAVMAYVTIFGIFTDLGMTPYAIREMAEDLKKTSWLLPTVVLMRGLLSLVVTVVAPLSALLLGEERGMVLGILIASAGQVLHAVQGPLNSALTARERLDYTAAFSVVNQLVFWGLGIALLLAGMGFMGLILASLVGVAVTALLSGWALLGRLGVRDLTVVPQSWLRTLRSAFPFGISGLADVFVKRFDTVLMSIVLTDAAVGWYNAPYNLIAMMLVVAQSVAMALYPSLVRGHTTDPKSLSNVVSRSMKYLLLLCLPIVVGGSILADRIILFLFTREFAPSIPVLRIALWALPSLFLLELLGRVANTLHLERPAARINILNAVITVGLNVALVPTVGVVGGALSLVLGRALRLLQFWSLIGSSQLVGREWRSMLRTILAAALMGGTVFLLRGLPLFSCIGIGAGLYTVLVLGLRIVDMSELRYLRGALIRRSGLERTA